MYTGMQYGFAQIHNQRIYIFVIQQVSLIFLLFIFFSLVVIQSSKQAFILLFIRAPTGSHDGTQLLFIV